MTLTVAMGKVRQVTLGVLARRWAMALPRDSSRRMRSPRFFTRILGISVRAKEAGGPASDIRYLEDS